MVGLKVKNTTHPDETALAAFLAGSLSKSEGQLIEKHLSSCDQCLEVIVKAHESVALFNKKRMKGKKIKGLIMKKINIYLLLAVISFAFSFITPRFFIQLLVATLLLGIKWIVDSKSTKMLVMIYEAWKRDGARGATDALETLDTNRKTFQK